MKYFLPFCMLIAHVCSFTAISASIAPTFDKFDAIYKAQLGTTQGCQTPQLNVFKVCSSALKNDGNAPFIMHHNKVTEKVIVLFHGLSDSPFFLRSIAQSLHQQGFNVVVALTPGHGKKQADEDMQDEGLADRWRAHVSEIVSFSTSLGNHVYLGGFSTGGTLAVEYSLLHPDSVQGLLLFSSALALDSSVEFMAKIWGIQGLAKLLDGEYQTAGRNPFKYPSVSRFSAFELIEVIFSVRQLLATNKGLDIPIFSAHSEADATSLIIGVKNLMAENKGANVLFAIPQNIEVCHADLVIDDQQLVDMQYDASGLDEIMPCAVPKANPEHAAMLESMRQFMATY